MEKERQNDLTLTAISALIAGMVIGCFIMYLSHKDIYYHYNVCNEQELLRKLAEANDSNTYTIKDCKIIRGNESK